MFAFDEKQTIAEVQESYITFNAAITDFILTELDASLYQP
jgi:hypothetical protein